MDQQVSTGAVAGHVLAAHFYARVGVHSFAKGLSFATQGTHSPLVGVSFAAGGRHSLACGFSFDGSGAGTLLPEDTTSGASFRLTFIPCASANMLLDGAGLGKLYFSLLLAAQHTKRE